eukprot:8008690-Karenia_brevis.AAC.1
MRAKRQLMTDKSAGLKNCIGPPQFRICSLHQFRHYKQNTASIRLTGRKITILTRRKTAHEKFDLIRGPMDLLNAQEVKPFKQLT